MTLRKKYYSLKNILNKNADYNMIIGERSNGKTFATLCYCIQKWFESGYKSQSAYLRRWQEDIIGKRAEQIFNAIAESDFIFKLTKGEYSTVKYWQGKYYLANYDSETKKFVGQKEPFCYSFALSNVEHDKSASYPTIETIVFDEFLTRRYYLPDEFVIFMNVISTIIRDRETVKIFMLGNTVNKYCPYFVEMGLTNIKQQEQGTIDIYSYGSSGLTVAVEYCNANESKKKSNKFFAFNNPKLNMIKSGKWELDFYPHLREGQKIAHKDIVFSFYVLFDNQKIQGDIIENGQETFLFFHYKTTDIKNNELVYTLDYDSKPNIRKNLLGNTDKLDRKIGWYFVANKIFYQSNDIGETIHNYLLNCVKH